MAHIVRPKAGLEFRTPPEFEGRSKGYAGADVVDEGGGAVQMGFRVARLEPGGGVEAHVHSFEESIYVVDGRLTVDTSEESVELVTGDYGLLPLGQPHAFRNTSDAVVELAEMKAPLPRERFGFDTYVVPALEPGPARSIDVRDPLNRAFGHIDPRNMDPTLQSQELLAVSASMRTALLVYSGITVKMMVDSDLGADLSTMFMVQYEAEKGAVTGHDHPLEETYFILEGEVDATFDDKRYRLGAGDIAWAGVGCVHAFVNPNPVPVRWLETQAPQPPGRHSYRYRRDWMYLEDVLGGETRARG